MFYELNKDGGFVCDIPQGTTPDLAKYEHWTAVPLPQPIHRPKFSGTRRSTGEWKGVWTDLGPTPPTEEQLREAWKISRTTAVEAIKVTTKAGNTFDGDEVSQGRMARAVIALNASTAGTKVNWVLADNSVIQASPAELTEALALAGAAQAALWVQQTPAP